MRETGGVLRVELHEATEGNVFMARNRELTSRHCICLSVCDTGHGIDPDLINRIFEPYFTTKGPSEGTGLGLAIVHGIIKSHNGTIMVTSRDGETRFTVYLPIHGQAGQISSEEVKLTLPEIHGHIMFVDDEGDIVDMVNAVLTKAGAAVSSHTSSLAALAAFTSSPAGFDIVITDQNMPHLSGFELAKKILQLRPGIPVILCTGFSETVNEHDAKTAGIREFIQKPLDIDKLAQVIKTILMEKDSAGRSSR
jgi:CheY-like chemotaxis protein